jgi:hypothetical protein
MIGNVYNAKVSTQRAKLRRAEISFQKFFGQASHSTKTHYDTPPTLSILCDMQALSILLALQPFPFVILKESILSPRLCCSQKIVMLSGRASSTCTERSRSVGEGVKHPSASMPNRICPHNTDASLRNPAFAGKLH